MFSKLANLHKKCFPNRPWSADDFRDLKQSGCEIIMSENGFIVYRIAVDEAEIITIGVTPKCGAPESHLRAGFSAGSV